MMRMPRLIPEWLDCDYPIRRPSLLMARTFILNRRRSGLDELEFDVLPRRCRSGLEVFDGVGCVIALAADPYDVPG